MKNFKVLSFLCYCLMLTLVLSCSDVNEPKNNNIIFNPNLSYGTVTDIEGNIYKTIKIGDQTWMAENLKTTKYRNGESIPNIKSNDAWSALTSGAQCTYNNTLSSDTILKFGRLYNWYAVIDNRNIAPVGWHIPTDQEFNVLQDYLSQANYKIPEGLTTKDIAKSLASTTDWLSFNVAGAVGNSQKTNNNSGFTALPAGFRAYYGIFDGLGMGSYFFGKGTNSLYSPDYYIGLVANVSNIGNWGYGGIKGDGMSVRCIKD